MGCARHPSWYSSWRPEGFIIPLGSAGSMATAKPYARKIRLLRKVKGNRRVPAWVMQRTNRNFLRHPKRRSWRRTRVKT